MLLIGHKIANTFYDSLLFDKCVREGKFHHERTEGAATEMIDDLE